VAAKHRKRSRGSKKIAAMGAATATATALTVGVAPPPPANALAISVPGLGTVDTDTILPIGATSLTPANPLPALDLSGLDAAQLAALVNGLNGTGSRSPFPPAATLATALVNNVNLAAVAGALGLHPESLANALVASVLTQALAGVPLPLTQILTSANGTLNLLSLTNLNTPVLNVITTGPPFTLLKLLGVDLGWVPALPNSVSDAINHTQYLQVGTGSLPLLNDLLTGLTGGATGLNLNVLDVRVPIVVGFGLGAFAAGAAYSQVVADLPNQPGGTAYTGTDPLLGSVTILPMILLRNPGRANGGLFARFYPEAGLLGIDTVTPDTHATSDGGIKIGNTGISLGGANLIPLKVDETVEYDPLSDFPAWSNPFSLANSVAAGFFPTYILRGIDTVGLANQLPPQVTAALANVVAGNPLALNLYLTVPVNHLPLLEPVRLPVDLINLLTGANLNNPIATALEPALTDLVNLGYTDVVRDPGNLNGTYIRTFTNSGVPTAFGTLPNVDWSQVPGDVFNDLVKGVQTAAAQGLVSPTPVVNPLATLVGLLGLGKPLGAMGGLNLGSLLGGVDLAAVTGALGTGTGLVNNNAQQFSSPAANAVPNLQANKQVTLKADPPATTTNTGSGETGDQGATITNAVAEDSGPVEKTTVADAPTQKPVVSPNGVTSQLPGPIRVSLGNGRTEVRSAMTNARKQVQDAVDNATNQVHQAVDNATKQVNGAVKAVQDGIKNATDNVQQQVKAATDSVTGQGKKTETKSETAKN
jgi:hypothetical protein